MATTSLTFTDRATHRAWLATQAALPAGFHVGAHRFEFVPVEVHKPAKMTVNLIALDQPTTSFAALFTRNAFPGAPIVLGRQRLNEPLLGALVINNKISNVCAPGGVATAERVCAAAATLLGLPSTAVLPSSTGVIGWQLPADALIAALPAAVPPCNRPASCQQLKASAPRICTPRSGGSTAWARAARDRSSALRKVPG